MADGTGDAPTPDPEARIAALEAMLKSEKRPGAQAEPKTPGKAARAMAWFGRLETWERVLFGGLAFGVIALLALVAEVTVAWAEGKAAHAISVIAYGYVGGFAGMILLWAINRVKIIRERVAPAADDSLWGIETWKAARTESKAPWGLVDAQMTTAAVLRFGFSLLSVVILAACGMLLAS